MTHLLDTNICSAHMRRPGGLAHRFFQHAGGIAISSIVCRACRAAARGHQSTRRSEPTDHSAKPKSSKCPDNRSPASQASWRGPDDIREIRTIAQSDT